MHSLKIFSSFRAPVPFREDDTYYEAALRRSDGGTSKGAFGRAVRPISDREYAAILSAASAGLFTPMPHKNEALAEGFSDEPAEFQRPVVERVTSRPFRDAAFTSAVRLAYEVQAAHIRPVADSGPDSVRNGIALCGTIHWMFDRGLLSLDDDLTILMAGRRVPDTVKHLINSERKLRLPNRREFRPHPQFLHYHRSSVFKG
jgi:putative restriction endonuclease